MLRRASSLSLIALLLMTACGSSPSPTPSASAPGVPADLARVKSYLLDHLKTLKTATAALRASGDRYWAAVQQTKGDYPTLWAKEQATLVPLLQDAQKQWIQASPLYEQVEGIVAGVSTLAEYDVILDAGTSGAEGGDGVVPFDLTLPDGRVLPKPGNLFGVTESTLWGTDPAYRIPGVDADFDQDGNIEFGEVLPNAAVFQASSAALDRYTGDLLTAAEAWQPTAADAFTALVVMVPTMSEYFDSWKSSRFVAGATTTQRDFVAVSRLADMQDILGGLQQVYAGVSPQVRAVDATGDGQITQGLVDLRAFVAQIYQQEQGGRRYSAEEADLLGAEAQNRATALTGQIAQAAARLQIPVQP